MTYKKEKNTSDKMIIEGLLAEIDNLLMIMDTIHDNIIITDEIGIVVRVSPTFLNEYGLHKEAVINKNVYDLSKEGLYEVDAIDQAFKKMEKVTVEQKHEDRRLVVTASPIFDDFGKLVNMFVFTRDITEFLELKEQYEALENEVKRFTTELEELRSMSTSTEGIVAKSEKIKAVTKSLERIAPFDANVLLTGESGVGKTMYAKLAHKKSKRSEGPFIEINCGAIPEKLLESELFGYVPGAFTGASDKGKVGLIELANNGSLFLDEVSEIPLDLQVKLLKTIQDKKIMRVGGNKEIEVDFRLISASNKDLIKMIKKNAFREDLYYRLDVIQINIPPLRERKDDIVPLTAFFLKTFNAEYGLEKIFTSNVYKKMMDYEWPGNIRQLRNTVERMVLMFDSDIVTSFSLSENEKFGHEEKLQSLKDSLKNVERDIIKETYKKYGTTIKVAEILSISQSSAARKITEYVKD